MYDKKTVIFERRCKCGKVHTCKRTFTVYTEEEKREKYLQRLAADREYRKMMKDRENYDTYMVLHPTRMKDIDDCIREYITNVLNFEF